jgi:hypothetical protein
VTSSDEALAIGEAEEVGHGPDRLAGVDEDRRVGPVAGVSTSEWAVALNGVHGELRWFV